MNRREFEAHLRAHDCEFLRHGSRHDIWINRVNGRHAPVPRHRIIKKGMVRTICRQLDVPIPPGL
jgi:hypothetical protein